MHLRKTCTSLFVYRNNASCPDFLWLDLYQQNDVIFSLESRSNKYKPGRHKYFRHPYGRGWTRPKKPPTTTNYSAFIYCFTENRKVNRLVNNMFGPQPELQKARHKNLPNAKKKKTGTQTFLAIGSSRILIPAESQL